MGRAVVSTAVESRSAAERVRAAVRERIGDERFAVWFGEATWLPAADGQGIVVQAGAGLTHEWLRRTFRRDVEAAVAAICGPKASLTWEPAAALASPPVESAPPPSGHRAWARPP